MVSVRTGAGRPYISWPEGWWAWRAGQISPLLVRFREPEPATRSFCFTCAGGRVVWEDCGHGEGWIGRECPTCHGKGWA